MGNYWSRTFTLSFDSTNWQPIVSLCIFMADGWLFSVFKSRGDFLLRFPANANPLRNSCCSWHLFNFAYLFACLFFHWYRQMVNSKTFPMYDYGFFGNKMNYGQVWLELLAFTIQEVYSAMSYRVSRYMRFSPPFHLLKSCNHFIFIRE